MIRDKGSKYVAKGIDSSGKEVSIPSIDYINLKSYEIHCSDCDLISLEIPENITSVWCDYNHLTELYLPKSVRIITCHRNNIKKLDLSDREIFMIYCDRNVIGLDEYIGVCDIYLY